MAEAQAIFGDDFNFDDINVEELDADMGNEDVEDDDEEDDDDDIIDDGVEREPEYDEDGNLVEDVRRGDREATCSPFSLSKGNECVEETTETPSPTAQTESRRTVRTRRIATGLPDRFGHEHPTDRQTRTIPSELISAGTNADNPSLVETSAGDRS